MVDSVSSSAASTGASATSTGVSTSLGLGDGDFTSFLTLLTSQLKNQDPLNPADSTEFVAQLAQFTAVEQQVSTNTKLDTLIEQSSVLSWSELAGWVGREVSASGAAVDFDGVSLDIEVPDDDAADAVEVKIKNADGDTVATIETTPGKTVTWDGSMDNPEYDSEGKEILAEDGLYYMEYDYSSGEGDDQKNWTKVANGEGVVVEARLVDGGVELVLDNGAVTSPDLVTSIRDKPADSDA